MTITRRTLYDKIDRLDAEIAEHNKDKSGAFEAYREQLKAEGRAKSDVAAEITACKKAFRRLRALDKDTDAVLEADALVDQIVTELRTPWRTGTPHATRVRRARAETPNDAGALVGVHATPAPATSALPIDAGVGHRHVAEPAPSTRPPAIPGAGPSLPDSAAPTLATTSLAANGGGNLAGEPRLITAPGPFIPEPENDAALLGAGISGPAFRRTPKHDAGPSLSEPDSRDDIRNQPFYRGAPV